MHIIIFILLFFIAAIPTYVIRYLGFAVIISDTTVESASEIGDAVNIMLLVCYVAMMLIAYFRGRKIGKGYLASFPVIAGVFDIVLVFIPFVPTVMMLLTLILGCIQPPKTQTAPAKPTE